MDVLRGIAVIGILLSVSGSLAVLPLTGKHFSEQARTVAITPSFRYNHIVEGKMRALFALLFGALSYYS